MKTILFFKINVKEYHNSNIQMNYTKGIHKGFFEKSEMSRSSTFFEKSEKSQIRGPEIKKAELFRDRIFDENFSFF